MPPEQPEVGGTTPEQEKFQPSWIKASKDEFSGVLPTLNVLAGLLHETPPSALTPEFLGRHLFSVQEMVLRGEVPWSEAGTIIKRVSAKIELDAQMRKESSDITQIFAQNKELKRLIQRGFEEGAEREPGDDQEAIDWIREALVEGEIRGEVFDWWSPRGSEVRGILARIKNVERKKAIVLEIDTRRYWLGLTLQWERVNGSEEEIGKLLFDKNRLNLTPRRLIEISNLTETREGVSLSVQISRAMNLYYNFLGSWAISFGNPAVLDKSVVAKNAQERLANLSSTNEGRIPNLSKSGVNAGTLRDMLKKLPPDLANHNVEFRKKIAEAKDDTVFDLKTIFGLCMFVEPVSDLDIAWTRFIVAGLSGSTDAEVLALEMLDFTGETDELNVVWKDDAYAATDYQKLLKMEERRKREAAADNPFGPEVTLGRYPQQSGKGWFTRAEVAVSGKKQSVREWLRGKVKSDGAIWEVEPTPFHKINWRSLSKTTFVGDFLLGNMRSWAAFSKCTTEDFGRDGMEAFKAEALRSLNKAFKSSFGKKDELKKKYGMDKGSSGHPKWIEHSPWVWYIIGGVSLHNPWKWIQLSRMFAKPILSELWQKDYSTDEKTSGRYRKNYTGDVKAEIVRAKFLTTEELLFVESFCQGKISL